MAQVVAHLIGSEEVTGPSPVISFFEKKNPENIRILFLCTRGGKEMWPFARPRPGTASRGKGLPYSIVHGAERNIAAEAAPPRHGEQGEGPPQLGFIHLRSPFSDGSV